jgi:hypothetical protein
MPTNNVSTRVPCPIVMIDAYNYPQKTRNRYVFIGVKSTTKYVILNVEISFMETMIIFKNVLSTQVVGKMDTTNPVSLKTRKPFKTVACVNVEHHIPISIAKSIALVTS